MNDVVRFIFETPYFIDPYQSYVEVEVTVDQNDYAYLDLTNKCDVRPSFNLDGPSTSLFREMILYSNSKEVERV